MIAHSYRKPHVFKKKKSILRNKFFWLGLLIFIILLGFIYFLYFSVLFQIKEIIIEKENVIESPGIALVADETINDIRNLAEDYANSKFIFWETRSIFVFNSGSLEKQISENHPQLLTMEVRKKWPDRIKINLSKKIGVALLSIGDEIFLMDKFGDIFDNAKLTDKDELPVLISPDYYFGSGEKVVSQEELEKIIYIKDKLNSLNIFVDNFLIFSKDKLIVSTIAGWDIYFTLEGDLDWQIVKLKAVIEKAPKERMGDLEYIEVRFGNLAPTKYKD